MRVYDFRCIACDSINEHFVANSNITIVTCRDCGADSHRMICTPSFHLPGDDPAGFPTAYEKWGNNQIKRVKAAEKKNGTGAYEEK